MLSYFEEKILSFVDIEELKREVKDYFKDALDNKGDNDVSESLSGALGNDGFLCQFSGITLHLLNSGSRKPFYRARLDILNKRSKNFVAWYEVEYGMNGEVLDDYFDLI